MIIADTSVWIEFLKAHQKFFTPLKELLERQQVYSLACIFGELLQGVRSKTEEKIILRYWESTPHPAEEGIWLEAGIFSARHKLFAQGVGLIDAVLIVTAQRTGAQVWTLDTKLLQALPREVRAVV